MRDWVHPPGWARHPGARSPLEGAQGGHSSDTHTPSGQCLLPGGVTYDLLGMVGTGMTPTPARMVAITHQDGGCDGDRDLPGMVAMTWQGVSHHLLG